MPDYKGAPLDPGRGPGLGCFWVQVVLLIALLILTPLSVLWSRPSEVSAALLIISLVLLFFVGQTMIFLLRLVAADRRSRRRPLRSDARRTVGQMEDDSRPSAPDPAELDRVVLAVVRGERPWEDLRGHGLEIHQGPPFDDVHFPTGHTHALVTVEDIVTGFRARLSTGADLRMWAFVVLATATTREWEDDTEPGRTVLGLLHDVTAGWVDPTQAAVRLNSLDQPEFFRSDK
jgi:hypothetical protein